MTNVLIDRGAKTPVYRQIAEALHAQIRAGEIRDGDRLPSERTMAAELGVNRTTVVNAYDELASLGLVSGEVGRGTVVRLDVARTTDTDLMWSQLFTQMGSGQEALAMEELLESVHLQGVISLASASADESLLPTAELQALINAAIDELGPDVFAFPDVNGAPALREAITQRSAARGVDVDPGGILVTAGAQQGLSLLTECLVNPGDVVAIETPYYTGALAALRNRGARLIGIPQDDHGLRVDLLEQVLERHPVKVVFTMSNFSNPSGTVLSPERRQRLLEVTRRFGVPVVDDDVLQDLPLGVPAPPSLRLAGPADHVISLGSLSKPLTCGLRVGWMIAAPELIRRASLIKQTRDLSCPRLTQEFAARLLSTGLFDRHLERILPEYRARRDALIGSLARHCGAAMTVSQPDGGLSLWCRLHGGLRARALLAEAAREGVVFLPGDAFTIDNDGAEHLRICFGIAGVDELREGARRLGRAVDALSQRTTMVGTRSARPMV